MPLGVNLTDLLKTIGAHLDQSGLLLWSTTLNLNNLKDQNLSSRFTGSPLDYSSNCSKNQIKYQTLQDQTVG